MGESDLPVVKSLGLSGQRDGNNRPSIQALVSFSLALGPLCTIAPDALVLVRTRISGSVGTGCRAGPRSCGPQNPNIFFPSDFSIFNSPRVYVIHPRWVPVCTPTCVIVLCPGHLPAGWGEGVLGRQRGRSTHCFSPKTPSSLRRQF